MTKATTAIQPSVIRKAAEQLIAMGYFPVAWRHDCNPRTPDIISKAPFEQGWGLKAVDPGTITDETMLGINHPLSRTVCIDGDDLEKTRIVFKALGLDVDNMPGDPPSFCGNPERRKWLYRLPDGVEAPASVKKLQVGARNEKTCVFEIRGGPAGSQVQDVVPPSLHETGRYEWGYSLMPRDDLPELPPILMQIWEHWPKWKGRLECILTGEVPAPKPAVPVPVGQDAQFRMVVDHFNRNHNIRSLLLDAGYKEIGGRYLHPNSRSGMPGTVILDSSLYGGEVAFSHDSGPLGDGNPHDTFDVYRIEHCAGDHRAAFLEASKGLEQERFAEGGTSKTVEDAVVAVSLAPSEGERESAARTALSVIALDSSLDELAHRQLLRRIDEHLPGNNFRALSSTLDKLVSGGNLPIVADGAMPEPSRHPQTVEQLNARYIYILKQNGFYDRLTRTYYNAEAINHRHGHIDVGRGSNVKPTTAMARNPFKCEVENVTYWPGIFEEIVQDVADGDFGASYINTWRPGMIGPDYEKQSLDDAEVAPWLGLLERLIPNEKERNHFIDWQAHALQFPHIKPAWAIFLAGKQRIGKDISFKPLIRGAGGHNTSNPGAEMVAEKFQDWAVEKYLIIVQEIHSWQGKGENEDKLKPFIAAPPDVLPLRRLGEKARPQPNLFRMVLMSNHPESALHISEKGARYLCIHAQGERAEEGTPEYETEQAYFSKLVRWLDEEGGNERVVHWLMSRDIKTDMKGPAPWTELRDEISSESRSALEQYLAEALERRRVTTNPKFDPFRNMQYVKAPDVAAEINSLVRRGKAPLKGGTNMTAVGRALRALDLECITKNSRAGGRGPRMERLWRVTENKHSRDEAVGIYYQELEAWEHSANDW